VIELGLGLGLQLGLGFVNSNFIDIFACWMKCCCIRIRYFCLLDKLLFMIKLLWMGCHFKWAARLNLIFSDCILTFFIYGLIF
jgi:hypothetical protein